MPTPCSTKTRKNNYEYVAYKVAGLFPTSIHVKKLEKKMAHLARNGCLHKAAYAIAPCG